MIKDIMCMGIGFSPGVNFIPTLGFTWGLPSVPTGLTQNRIIRAYPGQSRINALVHDPQAKLGYSVDWSRCLLSGDSIVSSTWTVPTGLTQGTQGKSSTATSVIISGGTLKVFYTVTNHIITANGLEDDRSFILKVRNR